MFNFISDFFKKNRLKKEIYKKYKRKINQTEYNRMKNSLIFQKKLVEDCNDITTLEYILDNGVFSVANDIMKNSQNEILNSLYDSNDDTQRENERRRNNNFENNGSFSFERNQSNKKSYNDDDNDSFTTKKSYYNDSDNDRHSSYGGGSSSSDCGGSSSGGGD